MQWYSFFPPECCGTLWIMQQCSFWLFGMLRIFTDCTIMLVLIFGMLQDFTDSTTMGVKHFQVVKRRSHANKYWSPDEIRVWHSILVINTHSREMDILFPKLEVPDWLCCALHDLSIWLGIYFCKFTNGPLRRLIGRWVFFIVMLCDGLLDYVMG